MRSLAFDGTFACWRAAARAALQTGLTPSEVTWLPVGAAQSSFDLGESGSTATSSNDVRSDVASPLRVPREFLELADEASCHRDDSRWDLSYRVLWRLAHREPHLLEVAVDADVRRLSLLVKEVHRDVHKMRAFVRFREVSTEDGPRFVAWFEPQHDIVERNAPFFRDRFPNMRWSILTPGRCVHWDGKFLEFTAGLSRASAPAADELDDLWRTYYASIFNPARANRSAMTQQMPMRYWKNLPEARIIPELLASATARTDAMVERSDRSQAGAHEFRPFVIPPTQNLSELRTSAAGCRACPLWRNATCTVFGEGPERARVVFVGEQPGDQEDRQGRPFVGPAGQLLNRALAAAGMDRSTLYLTNAVKHFKWEPRGKRRLHQRPNAREVAACRPWLAAELAALQPDLIVCLGSTAAQSVLHRPVRVLTERGQCFPTEFGAAALVTIHPSALLRLPEGADPEAEFVGFVEDLRQVRESSR